MDHEIDVRTIRTSLRLSQKQFAELLGLDQSTISQWENRGVPKRGPAKRLLQSIVRFGAESFQKDRAA